jgi:RNA polymerase sigma factor (sigma-70 family)
MATTLPLGSKKSRSSALQRASGLRAPRWGWTMAASELRQLPSTELRQPRARMAEMTLLQKIAAGEPNAVENLLERYRPMVWSLVRRATTPDQAEDLVQEVFLAVWRNAASYDPAIASEATYILTIAKRRVVDLQRRRQRRPDFDLLPEELSSAPSEHDAVELADEADMVRRALAALPSDQRRAISLSFEHGMTHTQISQVTQLPLGTVKSHVRRGLERVRGLIEKQREVQTPMEEAPETT